jgi:hypothetical protein
MKLRQFMIVPFLLAGCQVESNASVANSDEAERAPIVRKAEPLAVPPEDPCLDASNTNPEKCVDPVANVDAFIGNWKITRVHVNPQGVQAFTENDKAIVGSIFTITASEIKWTTKASAGFTSDDVCKQPSVALPSPEAEKQANAALSAALKRFAIDGVARLRFGCIGGGTWGPGEASAGAVFIPINTNQIVFKWYDGATLLAERANP